MRGDESQDGRASFGRVLESLDAIVARHPAGSARSEGEAAEQPHALPDNVVDLRARLAMARTGSIPDDAA